MKGDFDMAGISEDYYNNMDTCREDKKEGESFFEQKLRYIRNYKKAALILIHSASQKYGRDLLKEQEVITNISDIMIAIYSSESLALRVKKMQETNAKSNIDLYKDMLAVNVFDAAGTVLKNAMDAVYSIDEGKAADKMYKAMKSLACVEGVNVKDSRRRIADLLIEENEYKF
jgi:hypothetical protein